MEDAYTRTPVGENDRLLGTSSLSDVWKTSDGWHDAAVLSRVPQPRAESL